MIKQHSEWLKLHDLDLAQKHETSSEHTPQTVDQSTEYLNWSDQTEYNQKHL